MHKCSWQLTVVAAIAVIAAAASNRVDAASRSCKPEGRLVGHTVVFCGPATARLSAFAGATFRSGICGTRKVGASSSSP